MEILIPENEKNTERKVIRKQKKRIDPVLELVLKILICCAIIDIPVWGYFHYVKKVPVWEGLQEIRQNIQKRINPKNIEPVKIAEKENIEQIQEPDFTTRINPPVQKLEEREIQIVKQRRGQAIYSWTDEYGNKAFSNRGFPEDKKYTNGKIEWY